MNYMASIAWASIGLVFLLVFPFNSKLLSPVILFAALPYFLAMAYDFHRMGYKRTDVLRVYAFNLILAAGQPRGDLQVPAAGGREVEDRVRPHAQGQGPHGGPGTVRSWAPC